MVRYIVNDVDAGIAFYTRNLGFRVSAQSGPNFALLARDNMQLVLSPPKGPGGGLLMPDGRKPEPGGWNRIIVKSNNLQGDRRVAEKNHPDLLIVNREWQAALIRDKTREPDRDQD